MNDTTAAWNIYRTRFLIKARQLSEPLFFVDVLGREQRGQPGDYLVESSDGRRTIQPREIFEDIYVAMGPADESWGLPLRRGVLPAELRPRVPTTRRPASA
ncbi:MAG: PGDYG domain-containing protein [Acidobacteriia bacterium]|nr:PGDYG domain-containing protein [Terriglobia bacterium]